MLHGHPDHILLRPLFVFVSLGNRQLSKPPTPDADSDPTLQAQNLKQIPEQVKGELDSVTVVYITRTSTIAKDDDTVIVIRIQQR